PRIRRPPLLLRVVPCPFRVGNDDCAGKDHWQRAVPFAKWKPLSDMAFCFDRWGRNARSNRHLGAVLDQKNLKTTSSPSHVQKFENNLRRSGGEGDTRREFEVRRRRASPEGASLPLPRAASPVMERPHYERPGP